MVFGLKKTLCGIVLGLGLAFGATTFSGCGDTYNTRNYYYTNSQEEDVGRSEQSDLLVMDVKSEDIHPQLEDQGTVQEDSSNQDGSLDDTIYNCNGQNIRLEDLIVIEEPGADADRGGHLRNYPAPFDGANTIFVVGSTANYSSVIFDIAAGLPASAGGVNTGECDDGGRCHEEVPARGEPPAVMKDTEIEDLTQYNAIVIGTPCDNRYIADLSGLQYPSCNNPLYLVNGEGRIELKKNGVNYALIVTGKDECGIRKAGFVLENYAQFNLHGEEISIR